MNTRILVMFVLLLLVPAIVFGQTWKPSEYEVSFKIKNAGITVAGRFTGLKANLVFSPADLAKSSLSASVDVTTIKTGINKRDEDLQEEQYFNSGKYKTIEMKSTKLYAKDNKYAGMFNVTIKGVTKQVEIPFEFTRNGNDGEFKGSFDLNRRDFGVGGSSMMMSDNLTVSIMIKAKS
jgi:polyisoprenoid-binding protein YceI